MTTFSIRKVAMGAFAVLAIAGAAAAQTASPILDTLEVKRLVASTEPADNAKLSAHFNALAERYEADARRHRAMANAFLAQPARQVAVHSAVDHCKRLERLNNESANTVRELAAHHARLAAGAVSTPPKGAARFQAGAGAPEPTDDTLRALAAKASTPADHRALEEYFVTAARRYTADADAHASMAMTYRGTRIAQAAAHCDRLVATLRDSAKEATAAAEMHKGLANIAR